MGVDKPFPEFGASMDPREVPWKDAVVWSDRAGAGHRVYEWLTKDHIRGVNWGTGSVSIQLNPESYLEKDVRYFVIRASFIAIGSSIPL